MLIFFPQRLSENRKELLWVDEGQKRRRESVIQSLTDSFCGLMTFSFRLSSRRLSLCWSVVSFLPWLWGYEREKEQGEQSARHFGIVVDVVPYAPHEDVDAQAPDCLAQACEPFGARFLSFCRDGEVSGSACWYAFVTWEEVLAYDE